MDWFLYDRDLCHDEIYQLEDWYFTETYVEVLNVAPYYGERNKRL